MKKYLSIAIVTAALGLSVFQPVSADFNMYTGRPINGDAEGQPLCQQACTLKWNGGWVTKGNKSLCSLQNSLLNPVDKKPIIIMHASGGVEAGPIGSNSVAGRTCEPLAKSIKPTGHWMNLEGKNNAVCGCTTGQGDGGKAATWLPNREDPGQPNQVSLDELKIATP